MDVNTLKSYIAAGHTPESLLPFLPGWTVEHVRMAVGAPPVTPPPLPPAPPMAQDEERDVSAQFLARLNASMPTAEVGSQSGRTAPVGRHVVDIADVKLKKTYYGEKFIVAFDAVESSNPQTEIGGRYSWTSTYNQQYPQYFFDDVKGFLVPALRQLRNVDARVQWQTEYLTWAITAPSPIIGTRWELVRTDKQTEKIDPATGQKFIKPLGAWQILERGASGIVTVAPAVTTVPPPPAVPLPPVGLPPLPPMPPSAPAAPGAPPKPPGWDATGLPWPPPGMGGAT